MHHYCGQPPDAPPGDDDELIAACERFIQLNGQIESFCRIKDNDARGAHTEPVYRAMDALLPRITAPAHTLAGYRANARAIAAFAPEWLNNDDGTIEGDMLASLLSDLTEGGAA